MNSPVRSSVKSRWLCTFTIIGALFLISLILSTSNNTWTSGGIASFARMERDSAEPMDVGNCDLFREKIVHFDLKGAPPKIAYYRELFPFLAKLHVTAVLMEYEDTFPYSQDLSVLARPNAYSVEEIHEICKLAQQNNLDLIPLIQTFGHMEFVLKNERFTHLREVPTATDTICPSDSRSQDLIHEMLMQVYRVHSEFMNLTTIHIGADEAWSIAKDERCQQRLSSQLGNNTDRLKLDHISSVALFAKDHLGIPKVLVWNDMFDKINASLMNEYRLGELVVPVVWRLR